jgi:hypothetical protein
MFWRTSLNLKRFPQGHPSLPAVTLIITNRLCRVCSVELLVHLRGSPTLFQSLRPPRSSDELRPPPHVAVRPLPASGFKDERAGFHC